MAEIIACQTSNSRPNQVSNDLARMLYQITNKFSERSNFRSYSYKDEMISAAMLQLCSFTERTPIPNVLRFDAGYAARKALLTGTKPLVPNPLAYVTSIVFNAFLKTLKAEQRVHDIRDDLLIMYGQAPSFGRQLDDLEDQQKIVSKPPKPRGRRKKT